MLEDMLRKYAQSLHDGGFSIFLAQLCPAPEMNGHNPPDGARSTIGVARKPMRSDTAINAYIKMIWKTIVDKSRRRDMSDNPAEVITDKDARKLTFSGPPIVSYPSGPSGGISFKFKGSIISTDGS